MSLSADITRLFKEHFKGYVYPFEEADEVVDAMDSAERMDYLNTAKSIATSKVWKNEMRGVMKHFFSEMAFNADGEKLVSERDAYRLTLIVFEYLDKRLQYLSAKSMAPGDLKFPEGH